MVAIVQEANMSKIRSGQIYQACASGSVPNERYARIKVVGYANRRKVWVATLTEDGREIRARWLEASQLHETNTTQTGQSRRTGYWLVKDVA